MSSFTVIGAAALLVLGAGRAAAQTFTFDTSTQGWRVYDIPYQGNHPATPRPDAGAVPPLDTGTGLPAPSLRISDLVGETWIGPPATSYGAHPELFGQTFSFDIMYRTHDNAGYASVGIESPALSLWIAEGPPANGVWIHRSYALAAGQWRVTNINGALATAQEVASVLSNLTGVYIHTEWNTGPDDTSVDNISIGNPAPTCGSADFNGDGDVGTDSDIEAFFACIAGNCCAICGSADFNGDGDVATDADIEAFFRVLAGGSC